MNIINKTFLSLTLLPSTLYKNLGVDISQLKAILETKLTMDDRRPMAMYQGRNKKDKPIKAATIMTMLFSAVMGIFFLFAFAFDYSMITSLSLYFTVLFVMLSATLISDFTSVLIDIRDSFIILPKPVSDRTFVTARLLHIFIHICKILLPMSLPGFILMITETNLVGALLFWLMVALVALFSIFFINAVYILILKITTPQKFQSIISYIQIVFAVLIYGSYQIIPRMMGKWRMDDFDIDKINGIILYPMYWFASAWSVLFNLDGARSQWIAAAAGLILPFLSLYVVIKYLAPSFNNKLAMINNSGPEVKTKKIKSAGQKKSTYPEMLAAIVTRTHEERMGFLFSWKMSGRSRDFKLKVYPGIGYLFVYVVVIFWNQIESGFGFDNTEDASLGQRAILISFLYFTTLILTMALNQMTFSDKYKASWIYYTTPLAKPGEIILGGAKALMMKFYFPIAFLICIGALYFFGAMAIPHLILGIINVLLISTIVVLMGNKFFPFSRAQNNNSNAGSFVRSIFMLLVGGLLGVIHFFFFNIIAVIIIFILLSMAALWLLLENIRHTTWASIKSRYAED
jgi:ABC-2 type transport system permease protein